jgi:HEAT repeat protein
LLADTVHGQAPAELAKKLKSNERADRMLAANELGKLGAAAAPAANALATALGDEVPEVRNAAADALGKIGKAAVGPVRNALTDRDRQVAAARAAGQLGPLAADLVPAVIKCLRLDSREANDAVAKAIARIGEPAMPHVIKGLEDNAINQSLCEALRDVGPAAKPAVPALLELLANRGVGAAGSAAQALGAIGDPRAVPGLIAAVDAALPRETGLVKSTAANALAALGRIKANPELVVPLCLRVLTSPRRDDMGASLQRRALETLERFDARQPEVLAALRAFIAGSTGEDKGAAEQLLKTLGG